MVKEGLQLVEEQIEALRAAHFADTYRFIAGAVLSDLLKKDHFVKVSGDLEMYVRFLEQLNASKTTSEAHPIIADIVEDVLHSRFSETDISAMSHSFKILDYNDEEWAVIKRVLLSRGGKTEEEIDSAIQANKERVAEQKKKELERFPNIEKSWKQLCQIYPELEIVSLGVLLAEENPIESARYERSLSKPRILLPYNWRLTIQVIRNIYPFQVTTIAETLGISPEEVTDEQIMLHQFVHEVGHAVFQISDPEKASAAALERLTLDTDSYNYDSLKKMPNANAIARANEHQQQEYRELEDERVAENFANDYFRTNRDILINQ